MSSYSLSGYKDQISDIIDVCAMLYRKGMLAGLDGNVSLRVEENLALTTVSGTHKGLLTSSDIVLVDFSGHVVAGRGPASSEFAMHIGIYESSPSTGAIVHTHAPWTMALSVSGQGYDTSLLAETKMILDEVVEVPFEEPGTVELAKAVVSNLGRGPALILANHGAVTLGENLIKAFAVMECLEHNAKIIALASMIGKSNVERFISS